MPAPPEILSLVERFERNYDSYKSGKYNETQVRREFIDPFFKALGWDVDNVQGYAEAYKDVIHEDAIKIGSATKAPDYCFRIGGTRKFFVEAKKPIVYIKEEIPPAYQLRRYGWSAKLPLSILTDFEEFAVYDCRIKPEVKDKPSKARTFYFTYNQYAEKWDEIYSIFARESILKGSFDKYADSSRQKRGTAEVDDVFLEEIESWREKFAQNIALRNPELSQRELNFAVQRTIDRIIFLRICEDRGTEMYGSLMALRNGDRVYPRLCELFRKADDRYNSGLFHFSTEKDRNEPPDELTLRLNIDDKILKDIIKNLYYPDSPYEFSVISADILGQIYERFLGKVITLSPSHRASIEYKPEVKKAGGVFYTPTYIVDYIVKNTVGKLVEGKTPKEVSKIRILDPACGSGSFLIGAYQYLLDWHLHWYMDNLLPLLKEGREATSKEVAQLLPDDRKVKKTKGKKTRPGRNIPIHQWQKGEWRLNTTERKRILLNNIFGVDIDTQAVEVTKLSLLLKVLEGESAETIQLELFHERVLPDLGDNIKCGNSLIGTDILENCSRVLSSEEFRVINPFDWRTEFPLVFNIKNQGFDVIIGNPPYGATLNEESKNYLLNKYKEQSYQLDSYLLFIEKSIKDLTKENGIFGVIIPNPWLTNLLQDKARKFILQNTNILEIVHFLFPVFSKATVDTEILILQKQQRKDWNIIVSIIDDISDSKKIHVENNKQLVHSQDRWIKSNGEPINIFLSEEEYMLSNRCKKIGEPLEYFCKINVGIKPYQKNKGKPLQTEDDVSNRIFDSEHKVDETYRLYLMGKDINRYIVKPLQQRYLKFGPWLAEPRYSIDFSTPEKILVRQTGDSIIAALDTKKFLCLNNLHVVIPQVEFPSIKYILGLLNSKLINWFYHTINPEIGEALAEVKKANVAKLPIYPINLSIPFQEKLYNQICDLVDNINHLQIKCHKTLVMSEKTVLKRQIDAIDRHIDKLVYELYGLTEEEIRIVEESVK